MTLLPVRKIQKAKSIFLIEFAFCFDTSPFFEDFPPLGGDDSHDFEEVGVHLAPRPQSKNNEIAPRRQDTLIKFLTFAQCAPK